jgi:hypothetical protein
MLESIRNLSLYEIKLFFPKKQEKSLSEFTSSREIFQQIHLKIIFLLISLPSHLNCFIMPMFGKMLRKVSIIYPTGGLPLSADCNFSFFSTYIHSTTAMFEYDYVIE